ncbi:MAG TPA: transposase [Woeseiaceae bacterium]|jgi:transposase-like protein|nr:transposase [Chromatiales bacterium]MDH3933249.1 transposase [Chromatiales bacterium]HKJ21101.1 transposase [Woeseiaceae bacterium]
MPKRRNYSAEFKREAVAVANQPGVTKAQIGRELDVNPDMITRWQRELAQNGSKAFIGIVDSKFSKSAQMSFFDPSGFVWSDRNPMICSSL